MKDLRGLIPPYEKVREINNDVDFIAFIEIGKAIYEDTCENIGEEDWTTYFDDVAKATGYPVEYIKAKADEIAYRIEECGTDNVEIDEDSFSVIAYGKAREMELKIEGCYECYGWEYDSSDSEAFHVLIETVDKLGLCKDDEKYTAEMLAQAVNHLLENDHKTYSKYVDTFERIGNSLVEQPVEFEYKDGEVKMIKFNDGFFICPYCGTAFFQEREGFKYVNSIEDQDGKYYCSERCLRWHYED